MPRRRSFATLSELPTGAISGGRIASYLRCIAFTRWTSAAEAERKRAASEPDPVRALSEAEAKAQPPAT
jgi:hypothetical protein